MPVQNIPAGNIILSSSILFSGALPSQMLRVMENYRCVTITKRTFFKHQKEYLQPSILKVYKRHQSNLLDNIIGGDGRADSPGHSAKYGSYTMMELEVQAIQLVQVCSFWLSFCLIFDLFHKM